MGFPQSHNWYKQGGVVGKGQNYGSREMAQYLLEMGKAHGYLTSSEVGLLERAQGQDPPSVRSSDEPRPEPELPIRRGHEHQESHGNPTQGGNTHFAKGGVLKPGEQGGVSGPT